MSVYTYRAKSFGGDTVRGSREIENINALRLLLKNDGFYLISAVERKSKRLSALFLNQKFRPKELTLINKQLSSMLLSGLTLSRALDILYQQTEKRYIKTSLRKIYEDVQKGRLLSAALNNQSSLYPAFMIKLVRAGEASGSLDLVCERLAKQYENEAKIKSKIISALIYPALLLILIVAATIILLIFVFPVYLGIYEQSGISLPFVTKIIMTASNFLTDNWLFLLPSLILCVTALFFTLKSKKGSVIFDKLKLKLPFIKAVASNISASRFSKTMANLIGSGVPLINAIEMAAEITGNKYIEEKLLSMKDDVRKGIGLGLCLKKAGVFPPIVYSMTAVGEESGRLSELFENLSGYIDEEVNTSTQRLIALIEPVIIVLLAFTVGFIVIGMVIPMFDMYLAV